MSESPVGSPGRRRLLRGLLAIGAGWLGAGRLVSAPRVAAASPAAGPPAVVPTLRATSSGGTASVWQGYPVHDATGRLEAYRPPRRVGAAEKLPSIFWAG